MFVVMFSGPPKVGKDSVAQAVRTLIDNETDVPTLMDHFARPMREAAMNLAGYDPKDFALYNSIKDTGLSVLNGGTIRELMIGLSENFMKARYGSDFWGRCVANANQITREKPGVIFIPDLGFPDELRYIEHLVGPDQVVTVRLSRPKIDWANDSRRYVESDQSWSMFLQNISIADTAIMVMDGLKRNGFLR